MAAIKIANADEFNLLLKHLAGQIVEAGWHWKICNGMDAANSNYHREFSQSPTFWGLTFIAHEDATLLRLCRAYDLNDKSLNLANFLETIAANLHLFDVAAFKERLKENPFVESLASDARKPNAVQLQEDLKFVMENVVVKALRIWRNNSIAHRSPHFAIGKLNLGERFPISRAEIRGLLDRAIEILNRYSYMFSAAIDSTMLIGEEDFKTTLEGVRRDLDRQDRECQGNR